MTKTQIKQLRKLAHSLKPVVMLGAKGLSETVINEINSVLEIHELVKIQIGGNDKTERQQLVNNICQQSSSEHIYTIGKQAVFYKVADKPKIVFK